MFTYITKGTNVHCDVLSLEYTHTYGGTYTRRDINVEGHTHGETYTRKDIHMEGHTHGRTYTWKDIHMKGDKLGYCFLFINHNYS